MTPTRLPRALLIAGATLLLALPALAQSSNGPGWFVPKQGGTSAPHSARTHTPARAAAPAPAESAGLNAAAPATETPPPPAVQAPLPPAPPVPDVSRGSMPPAAVIGVTVDS